MFRSKLLHCLIILALTRHSQQGFLFGQPCSSRNTIELKMDKVVMPREVQCVMLTDANPKLVHAYIHFIENATTLYADHLNFKKIPFYITKAMRNLELIDLSYNRIGKVHPMIISRHRNLDKLLLDDNRITMPANERFLESSSLKTLSLNNNWIDQLYHESFMELPGLRVLSLQGNQLTAIYKKAFKPLKNLKYLNLADNKLIRPPNVYSPRLAKINIVLHGNPFMNSTV
ncbi:PREDICTED: leucine-rich repeat-containing protein 57-like [Nicrophorus vespilloides]|uniref:Leucine-rich repeat-containing protein 57-like n=1 Tax=Nicrophorus vespilloides TaxID=110193 RepID=A0ABM1MKQ9_NICVS|nr:PREDICTED: leucine-rich repeat-containing protein 57-like [Nicrophorus vespilloides]